MKVNFNNIEETQVTKRTLGAFIYKVQNYLNDSSEHFWLEYKKKGISNEKKWLRTENTNEEILNSVEEFTKNGL